MKAAFVLIAVLLAGGALFFSCGSENEKYGNAAIIKALGLTESDRGYALGGDPFCEVSRKLLNDAGEVSDALSSDHASLVVTVASKDVGVRGIAPFMPECRREAQRLLRKLTKG